MAPGRVGRAGADVCTSRVGSDAGSSFNAAAKLATPETEDAFGAAADCWAARSTVWELICMG